MIRSARARRSWSTVAVFVVALIAAAGCSVSFPTPGPTLPAVLPDTPVLLVHGYNSAFCPGADVTRAQWGGVYLELTRAGWRGPVLPVSYYACDRDGVDITGYGPTAPAGATPGISAGTPRVRYDQNTSIDQLAHDLGWFIHYSFTRAGRPVDLVASSMGGLIVRDLLYRVAQHDPDFPPELAVTHVVTFSTPYRGYGATGSDPICPVATVECGQFAVGSSLITGLNEDPQPPQGDGGTSWTAAGSSAGCDFVPTTSSLALPGATHVDYLSPCYTHTGYLWDGKPDADASARITRPDGSTTSTSSAPHSLSWLVSTIAGSS
jgi:hypothetical protein